jgi:hypothetical protein
MRTRKHFPSTVKPYLAFALAAALCLGSLRARGQTAKRVAPQAPARPAVAQATPSTPAAAMTGPAATQEVTKAGGAVQGQTTTVPAPTNTGIFMVEVGVEELGGKIYSTGSEDILVRLFRTEPMRAMPPGKERTIIEAGTGTAIYLLSPGPEQFLAWNWEGQRFPVRDRVGERVINLGKLPAGEVIFGIRTTTSGFATGDAERNPDQLVHAIITRFRDRVQVWFEDCAGPKGVGGSDRDFNDVMFEVSGGIVGGSGKVSAADLAKAIGQQQGEARQAAIDNLKKMDPKLAAEVVAQLPSDPAN